MLRVFILFSVFIAMMTHAESQANLEFNQVKLITSSETVPAGKVWKITGIYTNQTSFGNHSVTETPAILINGVRNHYVVPMPRGSGFFPYTVASFPLWLPAGTAVAPSNKTF